jgi:hypothetical protein
MMKEVRTRIANKITPTAALAPISASLPKQQVRGVRGRQNISALLANSMNGFTITRERARNLSMIIAVVNLDL